MEKALLNLKEFCMYLGIGETKARELLTKTNNPFTVRIGNRLYANKIMLDKWLVNASGNQMEKKRQVRQKWERTSEEKNLVKACTSEKMVDMKQGQKSMVML